MSAFDIIDFWYIPAGRRFMIAGVEYILWKVKPVPVEGGAFLAAVALPGREE